MAAASMYVPRVDPSFLLPLQEAKIASGYDPGSFQITASVLGLRACEALCVPRVESLFPIALNFPKSKPHWPSKPNILGACLLGASPLGGDPSVGLGPLIPWEEPLQL